MNMKSLLHNRIFQIALLLIFIITVVVLLFVITPPSVASADNHQQKTMQTISVKITSGDSLWSIASTYRTDACGSITDYIDEIKRMNQLSSDTLYAGCYLVIPCYQYVLAD